MGVLGSGAFSTNLTGLEIGKVYYFRTAASNGSGSVVSNSLGIFQVANAGGLTMDPTAVYPNNLKLWLDANHRQHLPLLGLIVQTVPIMQPKMALRLQWLPMF